MKWVNQQIEKIREGILVLHARWVETVKLGMPPLQSSLPDEIKIMAFYKMAHDEDLIALLGYLRKRYERQIIVHSHPARRKQSEKLLDAAHYRRDFILDLFQEGKRYGKLKAMGEWKRKREIDS